MSNTVHPSHAPFSIRPQRSVDEATLGPYTISKVSPNDQKIGVGSSPFNDIINTLCKVFFICMGSVASLSAAITLAATGSDWHIPLSISIGGPLMSTFCACVPSALINTCRNRRREAQIPNIATSPLPTQTEAIDPLDFDSIV
jgi:hypothetical protein